MAVLSLAHGDGARAQNSAWRSLRACGVQQHPSRAAQTPGTLRLCVGRRGWDSQQGVACRAWASVGGAGGRPWHSLFRTHGRRADWAGFGQASGGVWVWTWGPAVGCRGRKGITRGLRDVAAARAGGWEQGAIWSPRGGEGRQEAGGAGAGPGAVGGRSGLRRPLHGRSLFLPGQLSEDPKFPKVPWPTPDLCPACHEETNGLDSWDEGQVLLFLKRHYGAANLAHAAPAQAESPRPPSALPAPARLSGGSRRGPDGEAAGTFLGFSSLDMSLCVALYVASSLFLMVMFFFFRVRSRRWKVRHHHPAV